MPSLLQLLTRRGWGIAGLVLLAGYGVFLAANFAPIAAGSDSGGYLNSARLLARGKLREPLRTIPELPLAEAAPFSYVPLGYVDEQRTGWLTPTYPVGLPLHYAAASYVAGWHWGTLLVGVLGALAAVAGCYFCARELEVPAPLAIAGAAALAVSPMFLYTSLVPLSDTIATAWCTLAVLAALRARRGGGWAVACGVAFAIAVLVRPTSVLLLPVLLVLLRRWRDWAGLALGGAPGAAAGLIYNHVMYGGGFKSGYESVFDLFHLQHVWPSVRNYAITLPNVLPLSLAVLLTLPLLPWRTRGRELLACVLWFAIFAAVYAFYEFTPITWWYLRFILPAFPALAILAGVGLNEVVQRWAKSRLALAHAALTIAILGVSVTWSVVRCRASHVMLMPAYQLPYVAVTDWARANLPPDAAVFCFHFSSAFYFYTDFPVLRSDQFAPEEFARVAAAARLSGRPLYAVLFPFDQEKAFRDHIPGAWRKVADVRDVGHLAIGCFVEVTARLLRDRLDLQLVELQP